MLSFVVPLVKAVQEQQTQIYLSNDKYTDLLNETKLLNQQIIELTSINKKTNNTSSEITSSIKSAFATNAHPNPFNKETKISYQLPKTTQLAKLNLYNLSGTLLQEYQLDTKQESFILSASSILPGIYMYSVIADGKLLATKRLIITAK